MLQTLETILLFALPIVVGGGGALFVRNSRRVIDAKLNWDNPVAEQVEDFITLLVAQVIGGALMVAAGIGYVWWVFNRFVPAYPFSGISTFAQTQPFAPIAYWGALFLMAHMFAWLWRQGGELVPVEEESEK